MKKNGFRNQKWYNNAVAILIGVVGYVTLTNLGTISGTLQVIGSYFMPVIYGCVIAYMVNPLAAMLQRSIFSGIRNESVKWGLSIFLGMFMVILLLGCLLFMLIPQLIDSVALLIGNMDTYVATMDRMIRNLNIPGLDIESQLEGLATSSEDLIKTATQFLSTSLRSIVSASRGVGRNLVNLFLALILSFYLLGSKESIKAGSKRLMKAALPDRLYETIRTFLNRCNNILVRYIVFSILDAIIVGGVNALFMAITGMQYIGLISAVVGITNLIPSFGPVIGGAIGCFILLLVNPWHALAFLIFTLVLQTVDGYLIKPKLFGNSLGVSGLLILVSIVVFGNIMGILGILLAIPLAAIIDFSYEEYFLPFLERRKERARLENKKP
jgi:predicted PurR-regulated permease PerM